MRNEALENAGYSSFFVHAYASFMIASEMAMQNACAFINRVFDAIYISQSDAAQYRDNDRLEGLVQYTCNYEAMLCIKQMIRVCLLNNIGLLNQELGRRKQQKHSVHVKIQLPDIDRDIDPKDHAFDLLRDVMIIYCTEKTRGIYGEYRNDNNDEETKKNRDAEDQLDYMHIMASLLEQTYYAIRIIENAYDIPF